MGRKPPPDGEPLRPRAAGPGPGPGPIGPRPPRPPIPWTPFGPGDNATPDVAEIAARAAHTRTVLEKLQRELTGMRHGPGPDGTPPVVREVTRADGLWPYLVIRTYPGDLGGGRPLTYTQVPPPYDVLVNSPDVIIVPAGPAGEPQEAGRSEIDGIIARKPAKLAIAAPYDVWAHVWNLGRFQATGVRVRAQLAVAPGTNTWVGVVPPPRSIGGLTIDLGGRESDTAHRMLKVGSFTTEDLGPDWYYIAVSVTAESLADPATEPIVWSVWGADRHTAHRAIEIHR
jgi:hypothetical protein